MTRVQWENPMVTSRGMLLSRLQVYYYDFEQLPVLDNRQDGKGKSGKYEKREKSRGKVNDRIPG